MAVNNVLLLLIIEPILLELGRFTHRTSDIDNIGAKLNSEVLLIASVCRYWCSDRMWITAM